MNSNIYCIGAGGVGSWVVPSLALLTDPSHIIIVDADRLEEKNLNRQLFTRKDVGRTKAEALAERYGCQFRDEWFTEGLIEFAEEDWLIVCVDNHIARRAALYEADRYGLQVIVAANETHSASAYYYHRRWKDTKLDPRIYFPDILTDRSNDPRRGAIGCTGDVQKENPQLVTSNALSAALAGHLFALWHMKVPKLGKKVIPSLPYSLDASMTRLTCKLIRDANQNERTENEHTIIDRTSTELTESGGQSNTGDRGETAGAAAAGEY